VNTTGTSGLSSSAWTTAVGRPGEVILIVGTDGPVSAASLSVPRASHRYLPRPSTPSRSGGFRRYHLHPRNLRCRRAPGALAYRPTSIARSGTPRAQTAATTKPSAVLSPSYCLLGVRTETPPRAARQRNGHSRHGKSYRLRLPMPRFFLPRLHAEVFLTQPQTRRASSQASKWLPRAPRDAAPFSTCRFLDELCRPRGRPLCLLAAPSAWPPR